MASEAFTIDRVVAELIADPRLASDRDRCAVLHSLAEDGHLGREQYAGMGTCTEYPYDAYPWPDPSES